jgi:signal transduction histidine kinase
MKKSDEKLKKIAEHAFPWLVLAMLLFYSYILFFKHPYGFSWLTDGSINRVYIEQSEPTLMVGDRLVQIGRLTWDEFHADLQKAFFEDVKTGEITPVIVERNGELITIPWRLPGTNRGEVLNMLASQWFLAYSFWIAGLITIVFLRPKDERWALLASYNFITAIWMTAGSGLSNYHLWNSAIVLRTAIWLSVPIYLHLHWVFPRPLGKLPAPFINAIYILFALLAVIQWFQLLPDSLYFLGFLISLLGSVILLIIHFFRQIEVRRELLFMISLVFFAFLPTIALGAAYASVGNNRTIPLVSTLALVNFAIIPYSYLYVAFRRQLGGLEIRVNRIISAYFFIILLGLIGLPLFTISSQIFPSPDDTLVIGITTTLLVGALSIWGFPFFQSLMERSLLGIPTASGKINESYSTQTSAKVSINALVDLLKEAVIPSLLIRQFLFVQFHNDSVKTLLAIGIDGEKTSSDHSLIDLAVSKAGDSKEGYAVKSHSWARLAIPLKLGEEVLGLWLFGRRDPDDFYSQSEIPMLRSLANQTAIALSNILHAEQLRKIYKTDIERNELERKRLALELHDSVLNELAVLRTNLNETNVTPQFNTTYENVIHRLREIVSNLRPPMLMYGLKPAISEFADNLMERSGDKIRIKVDLEVSEERIPEKLELHLYRIVQEACENSLRYANPRNISISGSLTPQKVDLNIHDDGEGFDTSSALELDTLLANRHFGLAGMIERAHLVNAKIKIQSSQDSGTRIRLTWENNSDSS